MVSNYFVRNVEELMIMENLYLRKEVCFVENCYDVASLLPTPTG